MLVTLCISRGHRPTAIFSSTMKLEHEHDNGSIGSLHLFHVSCHHLELPQPRLQICFKDEPRSEDLLVYLFKATPVIRHWIDSISHDIFFYMRLILHKGLQWRFGFVWWFNLLKHDEAGSSGSFNGEDMFWEEGWWLWSGWGGGGENGGREVVALVREKCRWGVQNLDLSFLTTK